MVIAPRARWILVISFAGTVMGIAFQLQGVAHICCAAMIWVLLNWLWFRIQMVFGLRRLTADRQLLDDRGSTQVLWAKRGYRAEVTLSGNLVPLSYLSVEDRLPLNLSEQSGLYSYEGPLRRGDQVKLHYSFRPRHAGLLQFEGVFLRMTDLQGFFYAEDFLQFRRQSRVLPILFSQSNPATLLKQHNMLPPPGMHRHPKPGLGSELLELREYVPGDSPRSIAWKVSARRDCLMSKEFESEVPVRCTLYLDYSNTLRLGHPHPTALPQLVELAATITQAGISNRDPVGFCLFDDTSSERILPSANPRQIVKTLTRLSDAASRPITPVNCPVEELMPVAVQLCREVYPQLLSDQINRPPFKIFPIRPRKRRSWNLRQKVASVLAVQHGLGLAANELSWNDQLMSAHLQRFLGEHQVPYPGSFHDSHGDYLFSGAGKINQLVKAMTRALGKGHDNELFVVLADLIESHDQIAPLITTIKVAIARHHRVVMIIPWPNGIPIPDRDEPIDESYPPRRSAIRDIIKWIDQQRYVNSIQKLRREMAKLRVPVLCATESSASELILGQLEQLRAARIRR